jgi:hypothetical protein
MYNNNTGFHFGRTVMPHNKLEKLFANEWNDRNLPGPEAWLPQLLGDGRESAPVNGREARIAATIVQWLGSTIGQEFLRDIFRKANNHKITLPCLWRDD